MATRAQALRRSSPLAERKLWAMLRDRRLEGLKFRRQAQLGRYVVDFFCARHGLAVEVDGPFHDAPADAERDAWLGAQGVRVLRFANAVVLARPGEILEAIRDACGLNRPREPSPLAGEGGPEGVG